MRSGQGNDERFGGDVDPAQSVRVLEGGMHKGHVQVATLESLHVLGGAARGAGDLDQRKRRWYSLAKRSGRPPGMVRT
jgi:hypothetical protein